MLRSSITITNEKSYDIKILTHKKEVIGMKIASKRIHVYPDVFGSLQKCHTDKSVCDAICVGIYELYNS